MQETKDPFPDDIDLGHLVPCIFDIQFNPNYLNNFAVGSVDGSLLLLSLDNLNNQTTIKLTDQSLRCFKYNTTGSFLYCCYSDNQPISRIDLNSAKCDYATIANEVSFQAMCIDISNINDKIFITGHLDGTLRLWDIRQSSNPCHTFSFQSINDDILDDESNYISNVIIDDKYCFATYSNGFLCQNDLRKMDLKMQSDEFEEELLTLAPFRYTDNNDEKEILLVGGGDSENKGIISFFNKHSIQSPFFTFEHPSTVNTLITLQDSKSVITGGEDGFIRMYPITQNTTDQNLGLGEAVYVGLHEDHQSVDKIAIRSDSQLLLSTTGTDSVISFWDLESQNFINVSDELLDEEMMDDEYSTNSDVDDEKNEFPQHHHKIKKGKGDDFFDDL